MGAIPVINENDAVSVDEIKIGNNDTAISRRARRRRCAFILSNIEGLTRRIPQRMRRRSFIPRDRPAHAGDEKLADGASSAAACNTKLGGGRASRCVRAPSMVIASGAEEGSHSPRARQGRRSGNDIQWEAHPASGKSWIAFGSGSRARSRRCRLCRSACRRGSVLAAGISAGRFGRPDASRSRCEGIARSRARHHEPRRIDLTRLIGHRTKESSMRLLSKRAPCGNHPSRQSQKYGIQ